MESWDNLNVVKYNIFCDEKTDVLLFSLSCKSFFDGLVGEYLWQKESFDLQPAENQSGLPCLFGSTDFGENINDEWFIVFLLFELSKKFDSIVAQVSDNDGEFLLIQAAEVLPAWLKPETSKNRVFIHQGSLHIIPLPTNPAELTKYPTGMPNIKDAYELVVGKNDTCASESIKKLVFERIECYPDKFNKDFHYAHCYIPEEIVYILQQEPCLVANAVEAFYQRDPIDMNICNEMKVFQPENRLKSLVKFTRHLYAQLNQGQLTINRNSKWKLPSCSNKLYKAAYLGYKLTCGFEILAARATMCNTPKPNLNKFSGRLWEQYLINLNKREYFHGELEGSKQYNKLLEQAKIHFKNTFCSKKSRDEVGNLILQLVEKAKEHSDAIKKSCETVREEDSDDWMTITSEELDQMMLSMWGNNTAGKNTDQQNANNLSSLSKGVKLFVDKVSSYEGAEIMDNDVHENEIEFDPEVFINGVQKLLDPSQLSSKFDTSSSCESSENDDSDIEDELVSCFREGKMDDEMRLIMENMDLELKKSSVPQSFNTEQSGVEQISSNDDDAPLDVDVNIIQNFLKSFSNQDGLAGPVSSLLHSTGMNLPPDGAS